MIKQLRMIFAVFALLLLNAAMLGFSSSAFAQGNKSYSDKFIAPDGKVIKRHFQASRTGNFVGVRLPYKTIVLCSDDYEQYLKPLQAFADYVLGDMGFTILDGRKEHKNLDKEKTTFVYFGNPDPKEQTAPGSCLSKYPELKKFVEDKRDNEPRFMDAILIFPDAKPGDKYPIDNVVIRDRNGTNNLRYFVSLCFNKSPACYRSLFSGLFSLKCKGETFCNFPNIKKE